MECLQPAVTGVESSFDLGPSVRNHVLYRLDGGSGTDKNLRWLLQRGYQVIGKGFSGNRANTLARQVTRWDPYDSLCQIGRVQPTFQLGRPIDVLVARRWKKQRWRHSYYVTTLTFPSKQAFMDKYNQRGEAEIEQFRNDKQGLGLSARRKQHLEAQKALVLLTDICHNLLTDFRHRGLIDSPFALWGAKRIVRDLIAIPGRLYFDNGQLKRIELLAAHPYADDLIICLERYCSASF
ncbi:MAG: transposase [Bacteroidetes bacterium]|nr:transposase [Bacteroidota bacterium]